MRRWLLLFGALCSQFLLTGLTCSNSPSFIDRTQGNNNANNVNVSVTLSALIQAGDTLVFAGVAYEGSGGGSSQSFALPTGWTRATTADLVNSPTKDLITLQYKVAVLADASSTVTWQGALGTGTLGFPKGIVRVYRGATATPLDKATNAGTSAAATSLQIPALAATAQNNEAYVGFWVDDAAGAITGPGDLVDTTIDATQWSTFEGDKAIATSGTIPGAETATGTSGDWVGAALTLIPSTFTCATGGGQLLWNGANLN